MLPDNAELTKNMGPSKPLHPPPELEREQELSGLCTGLFLITAIIFVSYFLFFRLEYVFHTSVVQPV